MQWKTKSPIKFTRWPTSHRDEIIKTVTIHGRYHQKVEIKKIRLKIWRLRDELEYVIAKRLAAANGDPAQVDTSDLKSPRQENLEPEGNLLVIQRNRPPLKRSQIADGSLALMDLHASGLSCFSTQEYLGGQTIVVEFIVPRPFFITGEVLECRQYNRKSKVISKSPLIYRLHAKWTYRMPGERTILKRFLNSINTQLQSKDVV